MKLNYIITCTMVWLFAFPALKGNPDPPLYNKDSDKLNRSLRKLSRVDWPLPGFLEPLMLNDTSDSVLRIKEYLRATGDLSRTRKSYMNSPAFDKKLENAVKRFQLRHGLSVDGIAGENTYEAMNVPLEARIRQIQANIERLKSMPEESAERYIIVNIPDFHMGYFEEGDLVLEMDVIVGEIENYTPTLHDTMSYLVFNPPWNVPESITLEEILPQAKSDTGFLSRNDYVLLQGSYTSTDTIPPEVINWEEADSNNFQYFVVQMPGRKNSMGRVKFMFPNNYSIYLHDTPADQLFEYDERAFSHGCIRLEKPFELAEKLLEGQMSHDEIEEILDNKETVSVPLNNKVVVHISYQTAWVDSNGLLNFREDIYELDIE